MKKGAPYLFLTMGSLIVDEDTSKTGGSSMQATFHWASDAGSRRMRVSVVPVGPPVEIRGGNGGFSSSSAYEADS
jgi:hypothetical protein